MSSTNAPCRTLYTVGHSTRSLDELVEVLRSASVTCLVDIRKIPRSRTHPQFNADVMPRALAPHAIRYVQLAALGGRRGKRTDAHVDNAGWQVQAFRNYADYALTDTFRAGLDQLLSLAAHETCAIMCAEAVWWRCHRRIVADHVLARGQPVVHLLSATKQEPAVLTPFAVVGPHARVTYPGACASS